MEKAFLFDIISKLYIATDSAPVDIANFAICSEMIDVFIDISYIYGYLTKIKIFFIAIFKKANRKNRHLCLMITNLKRS